MTYLALSYECSPATHDLFEDFYLALMLLGFGISLLITEYRFYSKNNWNLYKDSGQNVFLSGLMTRVFSGWGGQEFGIGLAKLSVLTSVGGAEAACGMNFIVNAMRARQSKPDTRNPKSGS